MAIEIERDEVTKKVREFLASVGLNDLRRVSDNYTVRSEDGVTWLDISILVNESTSSKAQPAKTRPATHLSLYVKDSEGDIWVRNGITGEFYLRKRDGGTMKQGWNFADISENFGPLIHLDDLP